MPRFKVEVKVMPRPTLLDPEGQTVEHALHALGFHGVKGVRVGKSLVFDVSEPNAANAETSAKAMCEKLLSNPVTEDFAVFVTEIL